MLYFFLFSFFKRSEFFIFIFIFCFSFYFLIVVVISISISISILSLVSFSYNHKGSTPAEGTPAGNTPAVEDNKLHIGTHNPSALGQNAGAEADTCSAAGTAEACAAAAAAAAGNRFGIGTTAGASSGTYPCGRTRRRRSKCS